MAQIKPQLNLIFNKGQAQLKARAQLLSSYDSKTLQSFQSNSSQNKQYSYNNDKPQFNNSQAIIDKANHINTTNHPQSPISQQNLQMLNHHLISHFQNSQEKNTFLNNYHQYRQKIENALLRSAENIQKFNRSKSEQKSSDLPTNPLQKIRFNRFSQYSDNKKTNNESFSLKHQPDSNKETAFTFDYQNTKYSIENKEESSSGQEQQQESQNEQTKENESRSIQETESGKSQYSELYEQYKVLEEQYIKKQMEVAGMSQQIKKMKRENMELRKENMNLVQQKNEVELILKDILLKKERNKFRKGNNNSVMEESQKSSLQRGSKSVEKKKEYNCSESESEPKPQSIFELSTSNNNQTKDHSQMQESWMSASFLTHGKSQEEEQAGKNNMVLDLKQLSNKVAASHHYSKTSDAKHKLKIHANNFKSSQDEPRKRKKTGPNKENKQLQNRF